jgi:hypothetical protein
MKIFLPRAAVVFAAMVAALISFSGNASAQGATRTVSISKFTLQDGYVESDFSGLRMQFDMAFNWVETEFMQRSFTVTYRLEQGGKAIFPNAEFSDNSRGVMANEQTVKGKASMVSTANSLFVPYVWLPLESGPQTVDVVLTVSNKEGTYTDCYRKAITFQHKKMVRHNSLQQGFTFSNILFDYAAKSFGTNQPGMNVTSKVDFKYGVQESLDAQYEMAMLLRGAGGKVLYDSRKESHGGDKTKSVRIETREGKPTTEMTFFASYYDIAMEGPAEVELVYVLLGAEGGPKEIFAQKMLVNVPPMYNFEEQVFTLKSVTASATQKDGVSGISVQYACAFKYTGTVRNFEKGMFFFYAAILDGAGKVVIAPERAPTAGASTTHLQDGQMPSADHAVGTGELFIPLHLLNVAAGSHNLKFALMVSDVNLQTKFPVVGTGTVAITKPADHQYLLSLEQLDMIDANYDAEVIPVSSRLPELQYLFAVGADNYYQSEYNRNSLSAIPGSATLHVCDGDPISMVLYDVDSGFFNNSDLQGKWKIEYLGKGSTWYYEVANTGQVVKLRLKVTKVN